MKLIVKAKKTLSANPTFQIHKQNKQQERKTALLDSESGHFDYGIEEQLDQEISIEQMVVDVKTIKVNISKTLMELDGYGIQNESEVGDSTLKRSETTCLRIKELLKLLSSYKKENYIVNLTLMEIAPNKVSSKINIKINPMQEGFSSLEDNAHFEEIKSIKNLFIGLKGKAKIEIESNETYPKAALPQKVPQINMLLQEILKRLEIVENNQLVLLVTNKVNSSTRSLAHPCF
ncbi:44225_t:CDS:2 [Gigaspora margarita]|uniref:44225_t:CDS:1 n=1 Tax=Gigaspora margarita TaxID=4874 RepID=A0ABN7UJM1_GIGMA|nr:44225_t:CDS:2 [Gigaspora margarita]